MIDGETWVILGRRLEQIQRARLELEESQLEVRLVFDKYDQAKVVRS